MIKPQLKTVIYRIRTTKIDQVQPVKASLLIISSKRCRKLKGSLSQFSSDLGNKGCTTSDSLARLESCPERSTTVLMHKPACTFEKFHKEQAGRNRVRNPQLAINPGALWYSTVQHVKILSGDIPAQYTVIMNRYKCRVNQLLFNTKSSNGTCFCCKVPVKPARSEQQTESVSEKTFSHQGKEPLRWDANSFSCSSFVIAIKVT